MFNNLPSSNLNIEDGWLFIIPASTNKATSPPNSFSIKLGFICGFEPVLFTLVVVTGFLNSLDKDLQKG